MSRVVHAYYGFGMAFFGLLLAVGLLSIRQELSWLEGVLYGMANLGVLMWAYSHLKIALSSASGQAEKTVRQEVTDVRRRE